MTSLEQPPPDVASSPPPPDTRRKAPLTGQRDDERYYREASEELRRGQHQQGLWAKSLARSGGNPHRAHSLYLKWRTRQLRDRDRQDAIESAKAAARAAAEEREHKKRERWLRVEGRELDRADRRTRLCRRCLWTLGCAVAIALAGLSLL